MESFIIQSWNTPFTADLENQLITVSKPSCLLGIFTDNATSITQLCNFRVLRSPFESTIFPHNSHNLIAFNSSTIIFQCVTQNVTISPCSFCIIEIPCSCDILTIYFYLSPNLQNCKTSTNKPEVLQYVNLALIELFFLIQYYELLPTTPANEQFYYFRPAIYFNH